MKNILDKIQKIEALITGAKTDGEKNAAISAKERILEKFPELNIDKTIKEFTLYTSDAWHKKLLVAICRKYGVKPFRYSRQKYTTVMVRANPDFLNNIIWKEFTEYSKLLEDLVGDITDDLIEKIYKDEEEEIIQGQLSS